MSVALKGHFFPALLALLALAGCGARDDVLEPSPLPDFVREVKVSTVWSARMGKGAAGTGLRLEPAVTAQAVYSADSEGMLQARQRGNGKLLWKNRTGQPFSAGPVAGYGQLFIGTREGELQAYSAESGELLWKAALGGEVLAPPAVEGDAVVVKATDGHISLFERTSGTLRWVYDGGVPPLTLRAASRPLLLADAALVGMPSGVLLAIDRAKGQLIWERRIAEPSGKSELERLVDLAGDLRMEAGRLHVASYQGRVVAMELRTGQFAWQQDFSTHQPLAVGSDAVFGVDVDSRIVAWHPADGAVLWRQALLLGRGLTGAALLGPYLLVGDADGYLHVMRQADGVIVGRRRIDGEGIAATPVVDEGAVFVLGRGGRFVVLTLE